MKVALLSISTLFVLGWSIPLNSLFRFKSKTAYLIGVYLLSYAGIVLLVQVCGLLKILYSPVVLLAELFFASFAWLIWWRSDRPSLFTPFIPIRNDKQAIKRFIQGAPDLLLLMVSILFIYAVGAILIFMVPQNNADGLNYHLTKAVYWYQNHSIYSWPNLDPRQTILPINAEIGVFWTILWWGTEQLSGFVQWSTVPFAMLGVFGIARLCNVDLKTALFSAFLWPTLPMVILQSTTVQNDLVVSTFSVSAAYLLFLGIQMKENGALFMSSVATGLAFGAKSTIFFVMPSILIIIIIIMIVVRQQEIRSLIVKWIVSSIISILFFGSFIYFNNLVTLGSVFGVSKDLSETTVLRTSITGEDFSRIALMKINIARYTYSLFDFSQLPDVMSAPLENAKAASFRFLYRVLDIPVEDTSTAREAFKFSSLPPANEDVTWFGPLIPLLVFPSIFYVGLLLLNKKFSIPYLLIFVLPLFLMAHSFSQIYTLYKGRYYSIAIVLTLPLTAVFLSRIKLWPALRWFYVIVSMMVMIFTASMNPEKPFVIWKAVFSGEKQEPKWLTEYSYALIDERLPNTTSLGIITCSRRALCLPLRGGIYPYFGEEYTRKVYQIAGPDKKFRTWDVVNSDVQAYGVDYLLVQTDIFLEFGSPDGYTLITQNQDFSLFGKTSLDISGCSCHLAVEDAFVGISYESMCNT